MSKERDYKQESRDEFDRVARDYDDKSAFYYRLTRWCDDAIIDRIGKAPAFNRLLDVGCGTGVLLQKLNLCYPNAHLDGVDLSQQMLDIAAQRLPDAVTLKQGDAENLPYEDAQFDIIVCASSFHHYPNPTQALKEFRRILVPNGLLILCDMALPGLIRWAANHIVFRLKHSGDVHTYSQREITELAEKCGFEGVVYKRISLCEFMISANAKI